MNAAILCPGPSVQNYPLNGDLRVSEMSPTKPRPYDVIVGVNRAASLHACDFWCLLDHYTYDLLPVIGKPTIVCHASIYNSMVREFPAANSHVHLALENIDENFQICNWRTWSASLAIVVAFTQGVDLIECYGMDWVGTSDWDGFSQTQQRRSAKRWLAERKLFGQIRDWLGARGCTVRRVGVQ